MLAKIEVLIVVFAGAHRAATEVVEQDAVVNLMESREVEAQIIAPESVDTENLIGSKDVRHNLVLIPLHEIGHSVLIKQTTVEMSRQLFLKHLQATAA